MFVERERGLTFEHPVRTTFLSDPDFVDLVQGSDAVDLVDQEAAEQALADETALYGSLGLTNDSDPAVDQDTMDEVLFLGFYDPQSDGIIVRGSELTPDIRAVLVHELTHALQAQHFELPLGGADDFVIRSLLEGDSIRIEDRYVATLSTTAQDQVADANELDEVDAEQLADVSWTVTEARFAPYVLGPSFLAIVEAAGGNEAVNDAMRNPPTPVELLDPLRYLDSTAETDSTFLEPVQSSTPPGAESIYLSSPFGLFEAVVMFDAWLPWYETRRALDGWDDAAIAVYRVDGVVCSAITIRVNDGPSAADLALAVRDWSDATGSTVQPKIDYSGGGRPEVSFTPCADTDREAPPLPTFTPSWAVDFESSFVQDALSAAIGIGPNIARCVARRLVDDETFLELIDIVEWTSDEDDLYAERVEALRVECERFSDPGAL